MTLQVAAYVDGSLVPAAILRRDLWESTGGTEGISTPAALRVTALSTPGGAVNIRTGGGRALNRYLGDDPQETYSFVNDATDTLEIPPTGAASGRTDRIIARIDDWHFSGATEPEDPDAETYCRFARVSTLTGLKYPFIPLARIEIPASTATITQDMITDLRVMASPKWEQRILPIPALAVDTGMRLTATDETGEYFPNGLNNTLGPADIDIPSWATRVQVECTWTGVRYEGGTAPWGRFWVEWGESTGTSTRDLSTQRFRFDSPGGNNMRINWILGDDRFIPKKYRGTRQRFAPKATLDGDDAGVIMDALSGMLWRFTFLQEADPEVAERPV